jgi:hypothetical protein
VIEIESLPDNAPLACSTCMEPLTWIYVHHLKRNVAVIPLRGVDRWSFRLHTCRLTGERTWRNVQRVAPELTKRGAKRASAALAAAKAKTRTDERTTP